MFDFDEAFALAAAGFNVMMGDNGQIILLSNAEIAAMIAE